MTKDTNPVELQQTELDKVRGGYLENDWTYSSAVLLQDDWTTPSGAVGKRAGAVQLLDLHNE